MGGRCAQVGALTAALVLVPVVLAPAAAAEPRVLPAQGQAPGPAPALLQDVEARPDRALVSQVPGPVTNDELVLVGRGGRVAGVRPG